MWGLAVLTFYSLPCWWHFEADEVWAIVPENLDKAHHQQDQHSIHKVVFQHFAPSLFPFTIFVTVSQNRRFQQLSVRRKMTTSHFQQCNKIITGCSGGGLLLLLFFCSQYLFSELLETTEWVCSLWQKSARTCPLRDGGVSEGKFLKVTRTNHHINNRP